MLGSWKNPFKLFPNNIFTAKLGAQICYAGYWIEIPTMDDFMPSSQVPLGGEYVSSQEGSWRNSTHQVFFICSSVILKWQSASHEPSPQYGIP